MTGLQAAWLGAQRTMDTAVTMRLSVLRRTAPVRRDMSGLARTRDAAPILNLDECLGALD